MLAAPDRYIVREIESLNYGIIDVDLDRPGQEIRLVLKDERGAVLVDQPISLDQLQVRPMTAVKPPLPPHEPAAAPARLCPFVWPNGKAYFFHGVRYIRYELARDSADPGYPKPIAPNWKGLWPEGIEGAFLGSDGAAYFFKGTEYIRYDLARYEAEAGYPRPIEERWPGVLGRLVDTDVA